MYKILMNKRKYFTVQVCFQPMKFLLLKHHIFKSVFFKVK